MSAFRGVAVALVKGFVRDKASVFFSLVFPLMFLVLFGAIFDVDSTPRLDMVTIGSVPLIDDMPAEARDSFDEAFEVTEADDREAALDQVRGGDVDVAVEMDGSVLVAHYTQTDAVRAAVVRGTLSSFVDSANIAISGVPPTFGFRAESVEDDSLEPIQFVTPGLLGWAVAMSASFGAAATLQGWRQSGLMRRLQLSPASPVAIISARIVVTVAIALVQMVIFLGLATGAFGLELTDSWWLVVPVLTVGTLSFMALGLLAGAIARTAEGAVNLANFFVLPMAFLAGSFFSLEAAPEWLNRVSLLMPLRHLNDAMLDVLVRGEGLRAVIAPTAYVIGFGLVVGSVAVVLFRRRDE